MATEYIIQSSTLTSIADAIREKTASTAQLKPTEMADVIKNINTDGGTYTPETCAVTLTLRSFTGYLIYEGASGLQSKYTGSSQSLTVIKDSAIFIIAAADYNTINSVQVKSGTVTTENSALQDSNYAATWFVVKSDCSIQIQGSW